MKKMLFLDKFSQVSLNLLEITVIYVTFMFPLRCNGSWEEYMDAIRNISGNL